MQQAAVANQPIQGCCLSVVVRRGRYSKQAAEYGVSGLLGIHWRVKEVSPQLTALARFPWDPTVSSLKVWQDFFATEIGPGSVAAKAAAILAAKDSFNLPRPDTWSSGPGLVVAKCVNMSTYSFVDDFLALRVEIPTENKGALRRFDFWANSLAYMKLMAEVGCEWEHLTQCMAKIPPIACTRTPIAQAAAATAPPPPQKLLSIETGSVGHSTDCYHDCDASNGRVLNTTVAISDPTMTRDKCASECSNAPGIGSKGYAGVEFGVACFCSKTPPPIGQKTPCPGSITAACEMTGPVTLCKCHGNSTETCGGRCMLEVFEFDCDADPAAKAARKIAAEQCIEVNKQLVLASQQLMNALLATVETTGTIGSVENIMQHTFPAMFDKPIAVLERAIGSQLPPDAKPNVAYTGADRLFLTTARQSAARNTELSIRAFVLTSGDTNVGPILHYRSMGAAGTTWTTAKMIRKMAERGVWLGQLPATAMVGDVEYYVSWKQLVWPAAAPEMPHTVIVV